MKMYITAIIKAKEEHREEVLETLQNMVRETIKKKPASNTRSIRELKTTTRLYFMKSGKTKMVWPVIMNNLTLRLSEI